MDPDKTLQEMIALAQKVLDGETYPDLDDTDQLAELIINLDEWLAKGGALPQRWQAQEAK